MANNRKWACLAAAAAALAATCATAWAGAVDLGVITSGGSFYAPIAEGGDAVGKLNAGGIRVLSIAKMVISGMAVFYMVYAGFSMATAFGDDDKAAKGKHALWHALIAFVMINVPGQIVGFLTDKDVDSNVTARIGGNGFANTYDGCSNLLFCPRRWTDGIGYGMISFVELGLVASAVFMLSLAAFKLIANRGDEDERNKQKDRFLYAGLALVFVGVIEAWVKVVADSDVKGAQEGIFSNLMNLGMLFAAPVTIFFLAYAAYLYVTSRGDEDKAKQAKNIVTYCFVGVVLLLGTYALLKDLVTFLN